MEPPIDIKKIVGQLPPGIADRINANSGIAAKKILEQVSKSIGGETIYKFEKVVTPEGVIKLLNDNKQAISLVAILPSFQEHAYYVIYEENV